MISLGKIKQFFILASYRKRNVICDSTNLLSAHNVLIISTKYGRVILGKHAQITAGCKLIAKNKIYISENTALAYGVTILTTAEPNGPYNELIKLYPAISKPVTIGRNVWIGANSTILPGITIGEMSVVAAGAVVTKDVPPYTLVAGVPARVVKSLKKE